MERPRKQNREPFFVPGPDTLALEILDAFLGWCQANKAGRTYQWYRENIHRLAAALPEGLRMTELKPDHLTHASRCNPRPAHPLVPMAMTVMILSVG